MKETLVKVIALLGLVAILGLAACDVVPPSGTTSSTTTSTSTGTSSSAFTGPAILTNVAIASSNILVAFDFSSCTFTPEVWGVTPAVVGGLAAYGYADWAAATNNLSTNGTGSQELKKSGNYYYFLLNIADTSDYSIAFKAINYTPSAAGKDMLTNLAGSWSGIGAQSTGIANNNVVVSNYMITKFDCNGISNLVAGTTTNGISISSDGKRILLDVNALGGWSVMVLGNTTNTVTLTLVWTNIPAMRTGSSIAAGAVWMPLVGVITNTNTGGAATTNGLGINVTGGAGWLHTNGTTTWSPADGIALTVDAPNSKASYTFTVPSGSARSYEFKGACPLGWNYGEQNNNQPGVLPLSGVYTQTVAW